jgi:hypothetical protein
VEVCVSHLVMNLASCVGQMRGSRTASAMVGLETLVAGSFPLPLRRGEKSSLAASDIELAEEGRMRYQGFFQELVLRANVPESPLYEYFLSWSSPLVNLSTDFGTIWLSV